MLQDAGSHHGGGGRALILLSGGTSIMSAQIDLSTMRFGGISVTDWITLISFGILLVTFATLQLPKMFSKICEAGSSIMGAIRRLIKRR